jgi:hypothetical protein
MNWIAIRRKYYGNAAGAVLLIGMLGQPALSLGPTGTPINIEPDNYAHMQVLDTISPHVTLSTGAFSDNRPTFTVGAFTDPVGASTGTKVFAHAAGIPFWNANRTFRMDFHSVVTSIQLDYIGSGFQGNLYRGRLDAFSSTGALLDSYLTAPLGEHQIETMTVAAPQIAYALAYPPEDPFGDLDNLRFTVVPEPTAAALAGLAAWAGLLARRRPTRRDRLAEGAAEFRLK